MNYSKDFSKKVNAALSSKGISVVGATAVPAFEGDKYFTGIAYTLVWNGISFLRSYQDVQVLALSSWDPATFFNTQNA